MFLLRLMMWDFQGKIFLNYWLIFFVNNWLLNYFVGWHFLLVVMWKQVQNYAMIMAMCLEMLKENIVNVFVEVIIVENKCINQHIRSKWMNEWISQLLVIEKITRINLVTSLYLNRVIGFMSKSVSVNRIFRLLICTYECTKLLH